MLSFHLSVSCNIVENKQKMEITNSTEKDIPDIFKCYALATEFQKIKFHENQ